jgi:nicotinamide-nucleotide amidase
MAPSPQVMVQIAEIHSALLQSGQTISTAESLTGGGLSSALTHHPGASHTFVGGITAYRSEIKIDQLGVNKDLIEKYGVVSREVAEAMAQGALTMFGSTWAISTTGVAGPGPSGGVAAGTVWVAIAGPSTHRFELALDGEREVVRNATIASAIGAFARILSDNQSN